MSQLTIQDRVRALIASTGDTQAAFAVRVGLDGSKLSKALSGRRRFTSLELARVAETCDTSVDWLLSGEDKAAVAGRVAVQGSVIDKAVTEAAKVAESRENSWFIGLRKVQLASPKLSSSRWTQQGYELADFALSSLGPPDVRVTSEDFAAAIERAFGIDVRALGLDGGCDGLALTSSQGAKVLIVATTKNPTRQRFTMAHELSHLLCGDDQGLHVDENVMAGTHGDASEVRANTFAAALLMPEKTLRDRFTQAVITEQDFADTVMNLCVSPSSLAWRLFNLKLVSDERRGQLGMMRTVDCAAVTGRMKEYAKWVDDSSQERIPVQLVQDLLQACVEGKTTVRPLARLLDVSSEVLRDALDSSPQRPGDDQPDALER